MSGMQRTPNISRSKLSNTQKLLLENQDAIVLANGKTPFGEEFYVFLRVGKDAVQQMERDVLQGAIINFFDYGDVLEFGPGIIPPEEVTERVRSDHGDPTKPWWG